MQDRASKEPTNPARAPVWVRADWLVSLGDIARLAGLNIRHVLYLSRSWLDWPAPVAVTQGRRLWYLPEVYACLLRHEKISQPLHLPRPDLPLVRDPARLPYVVMDGAVTPVDPDSEDAPPYEDAGLTWVLVYAYDERDAYAQALLFDTGDHPEQLELEMWAIRVRGRSLTPLPRYGEPR